MCPSIQAFKQRFCVSRRTPFGSLNPQEKDFDLHRPLLIAPDIIKKKENIIDRRHVSFKKKSAIFHFLLHTRKRRKQIKRNLFRYVKCIKYNEGISCDSTETAICEWRGGRQTKTLVPRIPQLFKYENVINDAEACCIPQEFGAPTSTWRRQNEDKPFLN